MNHITAGAEILRRSWVMGPLGVHNAPDVGPTPIVVKVPLVLLTGHRRAPTAPIPSTGGLAPFRNLASRLVRGEVTAAKFFWEPCAPTLFPANSSCHTRHHPKNRKGRVLRFTARDLLAVA